MTGRLSEIVVPKSPRKTLAEVLEVLDDERPVVAGLVDPLRQLVGGQPTAERGGDRVARRRISTKTMVTRMKIVGKISRNRTSR